jgi:hypothetical protein
MRFLESTFFSLQNPVFVFRVKTTPKRGKFAVAKTIDKPEQGRKKPKTVLWSQNCQKPPPTWRAYHRVGTVHAAVRSLHIL